MISNKAGKLITGIVVLFFVAGSVVFSCVRRGKIISVNTGRSVDGRIYTVRVFSHITKIIAGDSTVRTVRKEIKEGDWSYNTDTTELVITAGPVKAIQDPIIHIEGTPADPAVFVLAEYDRSKGPAAVFFGGKQAVENRDYIFDPLTGTLSVTGNGLQPTGSYSMIWQTAYGMNSVGEMTETERDAYAELEASWVAGITRRAIEAENTIPSVRIDGDSAAIVMKPVSAEEKQRMEDDVPVTVIKNRTKTSQRKLSRETGFTMMLPNKVKTESGTYTCISTQLLDTSIKGKQHTTIEKTYTPGGERTDDFFGVTASASPFDDDYGSLLIRTDMVHASVPVSRHTTWSICSGPGDGGTYRAVKYCVYTWQKSCIWYRMESAAEKAPAMESFIMSVVE